MLHPCLIFLKRKLISLVSVTCKTGNFFYRREILQSVENLESINPSGGTNLSPGLAEVSI